MGFKIHSYWLFQVFWKQVVCRLMPLTGLLTKPAVEGLRDGSEYWDSRCGDDCTLVVQDFKQTFMGCCPVKFKWQKGARGGYLLLQQQWLFYLNASGNIANLFFPGDSCTWGFWRLKLPAQTGITLLKQVQLCSSLSDESEILRIWDVKVSMLSHQILEETLISRYIPSYFLFEEE